MFPLFYVGSTDDVEKREEQHRERFGNVDHKDFVGDFEMKVVDEVQYMNKIMLWRKEYARIQKYVREGIILKNKYAVKLKKGLERKLLKIVLPDVYAVEVGEKNIYVKKWVDGKMKVVFRQRKGKRNEEFWEDMCAWVRSNYRMENLKAEFKATFS